MLDDVVLRFVTLLHQVIRLELHLRSLCQHVKHFRIKSSEFEQKTTPIDSFRRPAFGQPKSTTVQVCLYRCWYFRSSNDVSSMQATGSASIPSTTCRGSSCSGSRGPCTTSIRARSSSAVSDTCPLQKTAFLLKHSRPLRSCLHCGRHFSQGSHNDAEIQIDNALHHARSICERLGGSLIYDACFVRHNTK